MLLFQMRAFDKESKIILNGQQSHSCLYAENSLEGVISWLKCIKVGSWERWSRKLGPIWC